MKDSFWFGFLFSKKVFYKMSSFLSLHNMLYPLVHAYCGFFFLRV